ncbi:unnamed protein product [Urochloa decumbens]|uniref:Uncharacterized protein n=1 Tax=Urochloa decumbens TaxID=240449 RepID=A0ABC9B169_9POAL
MAPNEWVLESGAYTHRTSDLSQLLKGGDFEEIAIDPPMREHDAPNVLLGRGSIRTECFEFPGVLYVPEVERNVVSVSQLARDHGLVTVFQPTCCHVKDETGEIVGKGRLRNGMYILDSLHINQKRYKGGDGGESGDGRCEEADGEGSSGGRWNGGEGDGEGGSRGEGRGGGGRDGGGGVSGAGSHGGDGRDGGQGGGGEDEEIEEVEETTDDEDEKGIQRRRGAYLKESSQAHRDLLGLSRFTGHIIIAAFYYVFALFGGVLGLSRFTGYVIAALYYILALFGGVSGDREGKRETSGGCRQESSQESLFGLSRFDMTTDPTGYWRRQLPAGAFPTSTGTETRLQEFLVDSGASFHVTWKESVLFPYPQHLGKHTKPPVPYFGGVGPGRINVSRSGYLNGDNIMLDGVLLALQSRMNLVSVGQLSHQYNVDVHMGQEGVTIRRLLDGVQIGGGKMKNNHLYVLEYFQPERLYAHSAGPHPNIFGKRHFSRPSQQ